ncbi:ROK family transcriptional regulator [Streptomyces iranensis]|uniref:NBD/HSP70 family sugar kinase n=1 Tax=Streptomyces iranensis TaxID=576784 RepID=A0A060ZPY2_9ACTN|nr:ROK family transcriptional regulator [Streptomyces iranensis]MBP2066576.1 putative NBD/HSP70 family sugar kinase [Streptomyces iranensis]CDR05082.1 ROK family protein [Streptomyces iranensis]
MTSTKASVAGRTASPSTARAINDRLALHLLKDKGPLTAGELKSLTGLSRPTIADLVERLRQTGLVAVVGESGAERRGPNARVYGLVADSAHVAGVDVRTDGVAVCVADLLGRTVAEESLPVAPDVDPAHTAAAVVALVERAAERAGAAPLHRIGIGMPGLIDPATGELNSPGGLPSWHRELATALHGGLAAPVLLENEVNLAAVAEQRLGAVRDRDTFVLLWLGHGIGAAVVLDRVLRRGASGGTGEIGFLPVPGTVGLPSATGCDGGFHSLVGSAAVCELAQQHGLEAAAGGLHGGGAEGSGAAEAVIRAALEAGERGETFLDALAARIALGVAAICAVLDPGCAVLGGEVGRAGGEGLARRVEEHVARLSPLRTWVRAGVVGGGGVLRGAVLTALDATQNELFGAP